MITHQVSRLLLGAVVSAFVATPAMAVISSTDVAIIGNYMDGNANGAETGDAFAWLALNDIAPGEVVYFSDSSYYTSTGSFNNSSSEGLLRLTVGAGGIAAGTVNVVQAGALTAGYEHVQTTAYSGTETSPTAPSYTPASSGDQLVMFQDPNVADSAGFSALWAVNNASTTWNAIGLSSTDASQSNLYPGLTDGVNALALGSGAGPEDEFDNVRYTGPTTGTANFLRAQIATAANWQRTDDGSATPSTWVTNGASSFDVIPEPSSSALLVMAGLFGMSYRKRKGC